MKIILIITLMILMYIIWQKWELTKFTVTNYQITTKKLKEDLQFVVLADLHAFEYGEKNKDLLKAIKQCQPKYLLIAGDMIVSKYPKSFDMVFETLKELIKIAPVYYVFGNHESRVNIPYVKGHSEFLTFIKKVKGLGIHVINNKSVLLRDGRNQFIIAGLEIDLEYYEKSNVIAMEERYIETCLGVCQKDVFTILLAHHPAYCEQYALWGADLTFSGHNHGGLIRLPGGKRSIITPQFQFFPKYDGGAYTIFGKKVIVSRGLGTHTFHIRIFNRAQLLNITVLATNKE